MDTENPHSEELRAATTSGDLDAAAGLALDHGRVVVRVTAIEELASGEHVMRAHGHLWQWVGTGELLLSLSATVRGTRLGTARGVAGHLGWEAEQVRGALDATDGTWMHVAKVAVADTDAGHRVVDADLDHLVVHEWSPPR